MMKKKNWAKQALEWLDKEEPKWGLDKPIDRKQFLKALNAKRVKTKKKGKTI